MGTTVQTEGGLTVGFGKKRLRDQFIFPSDDLYCHVHQQMLDLDLDRLLTLHTRRVHAGLAEWRRRITYQVAAVAEEGARKRLKAKEEEIERAKRVTVALEEKIRGLSVENQLWKELAQSNEAAANLLRSNLEQVLAAQVGVEEEKQRQLPFVVDDAESCCGWESEGESSPSPARSCRRCWKREANVLLLPCRHLCLCTVCCPVEDFCPVCEGRKNATVVVNFS
ncbi:hypothetical protein HPP92_012279 [Vanilla planifolia]|uniref:RING-type domain-containing protein n=1 Tax=Vanilla planifolia TaxID=51239 RepID=A0A835V371_VANPL|nr:hypothetical protein HPP92_012279 [Vanilla planifolia]